MLKEAANRGDATTIKELLMAGVPLVPLPAPKPKDKYEGIPFQNEGWLTAASSHSDALKVLTNAGASKNDQVDKDLALARAADSGNLESVRVLIAYGANPNADLSKQTVTEHSANMIISFEGAGSILIYATESGNPELVREILRYHPKLEAKDRTGKTAMFAAGDWRYPTARPCWRRRKCTRQRWKYTTPRNFSYGCGRRTNQTGRGCKRPQQEWRDTYIYDCRQ
jgi:ankyrin repeat protein